MTQPRNTIVSLADTPYYRCVRRAFLCGYHSYSKTSYEHRRQWLEDKLLATADAFPLKLCAYAVMSNHYHVVLHIRSDLSNSWTDREVVRRWHLLFAGSHLSQQFMANAPLNTAQRKQVATFNELWRARLSDISWYMRIVNEAIARQANKEDNCTGRFSITAPALLYLLLPCSRERGVSKRGRC